jgi:XTP/dITP diphosphohydrolase
MRVVLATANPDKAREITAILASVPDLELVARPDHVPDVEETGSTLEENATLKAAALADATGLPAIADDTGLYVDALGGDPGIYAARYAGEGATYADNVRKLLAELEGVPAERRAARFETAAVLVDPFGATVVALGTLRGGITTKPRGSNGFGYDPVFAPAEGDGRTLGEYSDEEKHALSHRSRAFRALAAGIANR